MIKSMTGFGRAEAAEGGRHILVEMRAVNHRYLDLNLRMPRRLAAFENDVRSRIRESISRGKLDVFISFSDDGESNIHLIYHPQLAGEYLACIRRMSEELEIPEHMTAERLAAFPEVFSIERQDEDDEDLGKLLFRAVNGALEGFEEQRIREGGVLKDDILRKLDGMETLIDRIEQRSPGVVEEYHARLLARLTELMESTSIDEGRLLTEAAVFADRVCTDEETVRLRSHVHNMKEIFLSDSREPAGRKLDFVAQEMNREANTTLSKCNDIDISQTAISLKTEIEKIREQVQNIE